MGEYFLAPTTLLKVKPETELQRCQAKNEIRSHALFGGGAKVRVIPAGESWPVAEVEAVLRKDS